MKPLSLTNALNALAVAGILLLAPLCLKAQSADSEEMTKLFTQVREHAVLAETDAELLQSYTSSRMSWESHARRIDAMREHVKDLLADFNTAKQIRTLGSPWQQETIDHLEPLLKSMAEHLNASLEHLSQNKDRIHMPPWREYVRGNREYASRTAALIRDYLDYGEAANKVDELERKLELPAATGQE